MPKLQRPVAAWRLHLGDRLGAALLVLAIAERVLKHLAIVRFFRRQRPAPPACERPLVSIVQPILSGDPTLAASLEASLGFRSSYPREWLWLVDADDAEGRRVCTSLIARHPDAAVRLLVRPVSGSQGVADQRLSTNDEGSTQPGLGPSSFVLRPQPPVENPKTAKLIVGAAEARGAILCVLDDDTRLPDDALEQALPYLDGPGVGLAFGLPYYVSFDTLWSALVACFVNGNSLATYVPAAMLAEPSTINGMFYALRRETLAAVGGYHGLEGMVADDFAIARRLRAGGYRLAQTPLRHAISTTVEGPGHYWRLMQRWLIFPRVSLMRGLPPGERVRFYLVAALPLAAPWLAYGALARGSPAARGLALAYLAYSGAMTAHLNRAYLGGATPDRWAWLGPLVQLALPAQAIAALVAPRRISWRGHRMALTADGRLRVVRRRDPSA